jgi:hypothetical protein
MYFIGHEIMSQTVSSTEPDEALWYELLEGDDVDEV